MAKNDNWPGGDAPSRRQFLARAARGACGAGLFATAIVLVGQRAAARTPNALRPPGALAENKFLSACLRCGLCVRDCPYPTLSLAGFGDAVGFGTPYFIARQAPCEMCEDLPCVKACPSGALDEGLTQIDDARMGIAVLTDQETCLNFNGMRCDVCYRACPLLGKAITLERQPNRRTKRHALFIPTVHSDKCTGCGKCERVCVLEEAAIRIYPRRLVKGRAGSHYRLGWVEKERRGGPLVPGIRDLPDRLPEAQP